MYFFLGGHPRVTFGSRTEPCQKLSQMPLMRVLCPVQAQPSKRQFDYIQISRPCSTVVLDGIFHRAVSSSRRGGTIAEDLVKIKNSIPNGPPLVVALQPYKSTKNKQIKQADTLPLRTQKIKINRERKEKESYKCTGPGKLTMDTSRSPFDISQSINSLEGSRPTKVGRTERAMFHQSCGLNASIGRAPKVFTGNLIQGGCGLELVDQKHLTAMELFCSSSAGFQIGISRTLDPLGGCCL